MRKVKLGLIGMGLIGAAHVKTLQKVDDCQLVAISDVDEKHKETASRLDIKYYRDYEEMISKESLQGVIIATPNHLHAPMGIAFAT